MELSDSFKRISVPGTGRTAVQLTQGHSWCYPLYYFIPSLDRTFRYLMHHVCDANSHDVQIHRLDLHTGECIQLTQGHEANTGWYPWCQNQGSGVRDHLSALNVAKDELYWWSNHRLYCTNILTLEQRELFHLPPGRMAIGQNCFTPDGQWYVYIHHDEKSYQRMLKEGYWGARHLSRETQLRAYHTETGEDRLLIVINSPIHHVLPYGNDRLIFCHPTTENGMLMTDLQGGWFTQLRTRDENGGSVCHYVTTEKGIMYEVLTDIFGNPEAPPIMGGLYDPQTHERVELYMPDCFGYTHTALDPKGETWLFENVIRRDSEDGRWKAGDHHVLWLKDFEARQWINITGDWPSFGEGQRSHFHPQVLPGGEWMLMTTGDPDSQTNHMFLVEINDLSPTANVPALTR